MGFLVKDYFLAISQRPPAQLAFFIKKDLVGLLGKRLIDAFCGLIGHFRRSDDDAQFRVDIRGAGIEIE